MVMVEGSLIVFGVMLSYWIDLGFSFLEPSSIAWRFPIGFQIVLAVFILCFIPGLPESPRWLVLKGRDEEALEVLAALSSLPVSDKKIQAEFQSVKDAVFEMSKGGFRECFKMNRNRNFHRTALAYVNQMFQQVRFSTALCGVHPLTLLRFLVLTSLRTTPRRSSKTVSASRPFSVVCYPHVMELNTGSRHGLQSSPLRNLAAVH
jgi:MFS family permease